MAISGLGEFFESLFGDNHNKKPDTKVNDEEWKKLAKSLDDLSESAADATVIADLYKKRLDEARQTMDGFKPNTKEWFQAQQDWNDMLSEFNKAVKETDKAHKKYQEHLAIAANRTGVTADAIESYNKSLQSSSKEHVTAKKSGGALMDTLNSKLGNFSTLIKLNLFTALSLATEQLIEMNKELADLQRKSGGILSSNIIGFNEFGGNNSTVNGGGVKSTALNNGLETSEFLETFKAFDKGKILGGVNLQEEQKNLKEYGAEIGKLNKFYIGNSEATRKVASVLTNQYGKGIKETTDIMSKAAGAAKDAGLNVGVFYDNMAKIADLQGSMFIAGGAEGIVKSANALTKLGLSVQTLSKMADSYTGLNDVINKQQQASALGLQNIAAAQNKIFSQIYNGDSAGGLKTAQFAAAQDINRLGYKDKNGTINTQGVQSLKAAGYDEEQIKSVQRLINEQKRIGASFEALRTGIGLTNEQMRMKAQIDEENMTIGEKFGVLWGQVNATIIEPLANILGPLLKLTIGVVTETFKILNWALTPVIWLFKKVGDILSGFSSMGAVTKTLGTILAVLIAWKAWSMAKQAGGFVKDIVGDIMGSKLGGKLGGLFGKGGRLSKLGQWFGNSKLGQAGSGLLEKIGGTKLGGKAFGLGSKAFGLGSKALSKMGLIGGAGAGAGDAMSILSQAQFGEGAAVSGGGLAKGLKGGLGLALGFAGDWLGEKVKGDSKEGSGASTAGKALSWGAQGAGMGLMLGPLGAAIGGGIGALAGVINEQWEPLTKGFSKFMEHPIDNGLDLLFSPITTIAKLVGGIAGDNKKKGDKKDLDVKIGQIASQSAKLPEMRAIMEGRKMDYSKAEQSEKENMINSNSGTNLVNKEPIVNVKITNDSHSMGGLKSQIAGH